MPKKKKEEEKWIPGRPEDYVRYSEREDYLRYSNKKSSDIKGETSSDGKTDERPEKPENSTFESKSDTPEKAELNLDDVNFVL